MLGTAAIKAAVVGRDKLIVHKHALLTKLASISCDEIRALLRFGVQNEAIGGLTVVSFSSTLVSPRGAFL